ncbi:hypothetical protein PSACC_00608 [Paramicrosporidium saccamoebae]|uniref:Inorganic phosphate transporter Pho88 n=1 Tax=Paramicrosporidium saccamoebae TaxID=1246581 RepID=A0A2H9TPC3_9FUNG|nr:hypothetical protein PSACC_00608 [Paramicrosporidium saccamoebae]
MAVSLSTLNSPLVTMAMVFGSIQLLRFVDMTNPRTINLLRMGYITSQMLMLLLWNYIRTRCKSGKKNGDMVEVEEPATPFSGEPAKTRKMTVLEYDTMEAGKQLQQVIIGTVIMLVLHFWFGMVQPLFLQILLPWKSVVAQPLIQIHLFGFPATGALKRPFKQPNPFAEFTQEQTAEPDTEETREIEDDKSPKTAAKGKKKGGRKED